jgi:hypothetical protein
MKIITSIGASDYGGVLNEPEKIPKFEIKIEEIRTQKDVKDAIAFLTQVDTDKTISVKPL